MDTVHWVLIVFLGLGLAASSGFNAPLPLLMLAALAHFHVAGVVLRGNFAWLSSTGALVALAAVIELVGDKIPGVDHVLHACGVFIRPLAGVLAATSVMTHVDPGMAALAGLIIGGPVSLGISGATGAVRVASTATTFGCANPFLSALEDFSAVVLSLSAFFAPVLVPVFLIGIALVLWKLVQSVRRTPPVVPAS